VQYVALRNIDLLLQAKPDILSKELRVFFCKYNDPPYVKLQKLEIMVRIANEKNFDQLLSELKEYALEVDMDFVKRAVKAIGQVAIKIEAASEKCVNALLDLIATKVNYVVQEVIVVIKDILRKYPGYEGVIPTLCKYIDELDEPNARGSLIWIVGEYAEKINNADAILSGFVDVFSEEFTQVRRLLGGDEVIWLTPGRHNYRSSPPWSSCFSKSRATTKGSCRKSCSWLQQTATIRISATALTSTGVCSRVIWTSPRSAPLLYSSKLAVC
jgi:vesicle coat complex subunit